MKEKIENDISREEIMAALKGMKNNKQDQMDLPQNFSNSFSQI